MNFYLKQQYVILITFKNLDIECNTETKLSRNCKLIQQNVVFGKEKKTITKDNILGICQMFVFCNDINPIDSNDNRFSEIQL